MEECSEIGLNMIERGGNAMDAAVAAMFCVGVVNAESSGLGGYVFVLFMIRFKCLSGFMVMICYTKYFKGCRTNSMYWDR